MKKFIFQKKPLFDEKEAEACYNYMKTDMWLTEFKKTQELEKMICDFTGAKYCHMVNNGTISLSIALLALNIQKNDIVIVPDFTMIATPNAVKFIGAEPLLVDVEKDTLCIDINKIEKLLKKLTEMIKRLGDRVHKEYNLDIAVQNMDKVFEDIYSKMKSSN